MVNIVYAADRFVACKTMNVFDEVQRSERQVGARILGELN